MKIVRPLLILLVLGGAGFGVYRYANRRPTSLTLTGIVTTNDVIVSPQIAGQIRQLLVNEGDVVKKDQLLAVITPDELRADSAYYAHSAEGVGVAGAARARRRCASRSGRRPTRSARPRRRSPPPRRSRPPPTPTSRTRGSRSSAPAKLSQQGVAPAQQLDQARTALRRREGAARLAAEAGRRAALGASRWPASNAEQVAIRRSQLAGEPAASRPPPTRSATKADVRLAYTELHAPIDGIVDVRAVRVGEVVTPASRSSRSINPDDLWVRADVEETYIDRVRIGDTLTVRLPSGDEREGTVFYRGVDAGVRHAARRQPHQARHQDVRDPAARRQPRSPPRRRHDGVRAAAGALMRRHRRPEHRQEVRRLHGRQRHQLRRRGGRDLRPARAERRRQVDADPHADDAAAADLGHGASSTASTSSSRPTACAGRSASFRRR